MGSSTVLTVSVPFSLESVTMTSVPSTVPSFQSPSPPLSIAHRTLRSLLFEHLSAGHTVEIDVQGSGEENWERLEDFLTKATADGLDRSHHLL